MLVETQCGEVSWTKVSEFSSISNLQFAVCEHKVIAKVSVTKNLRQRNNVRGDAA